MGVAMSFLWLALLAFLYEVIAPLGAWWLIGLQVGR
jgi:hypothetical protein